MFIEENEGVIMASPIVSLTNKHKRLKGLIKQLHDRLEESRKTKVTKEWLKKRLGKVLETRQGLSEILIIF